MNFIDKLLFPKYTLENVTVVKSNDDFYRIKLKLTRHGVFGDRLISRYHEDCCAGGDSYPWHSRAKEKADKEVLRVSKNIKSDYCIWFFYQNRYTIIIHYLEIILEINNIRPLDDKIAEIVGTVIVLFCAIAPVAAILKVKVYDVYVKPFLKTLF